MFAIIVSLSSFFVEELCCLQLAIKAIVKISNGIFFIIVGNGLARMFTKPNFIIYVKIVNFIQTIQANIEGTQGFWLDTPLISDHRNTALL